ncbi:MAG TPA: glycine/sarcosine/betaine reductase component B subunit [Candidatus Methylomirabilis sp.]|nr:glycine/sarcosine/betaine reductase component B subunit [Candidatus Methylomirabilis sp.]
MRLELGTFPVTEVAFGSRTRYERGRLEVDREAALAAVREDPRIVTVDLEIAGPGESVRIWPVRDVIEPRVKVEGPGICYPGICGRDITTVGEGRTHRLAGMGVVEVSSVNWHDSGGDFVETYLDMSGQFADMYPYGRLQNLCVVVEPDPALGDESRNDAVHRAALTVSDHVAAAVRHLTPPEREVFTLDPVPRDLPRVVYIWCVHSPQAMSGSPTAFCTATYGLTQLTPPWLLHPNEILDGALTGPYRTAFAMSWTVANNPVLLNLYRRHGKDWGFLGVIVLRTEWTTQTEKQLMGNQTAKLASMLGAQGAVVTWDAGGNEFIEVVRSIQACERLGIKTVFLTSEDDATDGAPTMLEPLPEADAIVSTGFFKNTTLGVPDAPAVKRVIGLPYKMVSGDRRTGSGRGRDQQVATMGPLPPPWRYDDHYGFGSLSCIE